MIRLSKSCVSGNEVSRVAEVLSAEFLGMGEVVREFEDDLTNFIGRSATCVSTGTSAIQLALQAANVKPGDEVLVQSLTYVATFQAICAIGAIPVPCDINPTTLTISLTSAEKKISDRTRVIMPVHYAGDPHGLDEVLSFAAKYDLRVIEDAAHAFGSRFNEQLVGSFGDVTCFSFDGIKNITSGEGGCIVTSDDRITQRVRDLRLLGIENDTQMRYAGQRSWEFDVMEQGWRYHMSNIMAAIGIEQLKRRDTLFSKRQQLALYYDKLLDGVSEIELFSRDYTAIVPHIYVVKLRIGADRAAIRTRLLDLGIQTGVHYQPCHKLSYFSKLENSNDLENTNLLYPRLLSLPLHPDLEYNDVDRVVSELETCLR
jgi:dTDP-4-amino-4,6-dideoxygalactose transaminase